VHAKILPAAARIAARVFWRLRCWNAARRFGGEAPEAGSAAVTVATIVLRACICLLDPRITTCVAARVARALARSGEG